MLATAVSSTQINVTWSASTDNVGVAGYRVFRNGTQVGATTTALSYSDTGLTPSTQYTYTVVAFDAAGNASAPSTGSTATTLTPDTTPPNVSITAPAQNATVSNTVTVSATATDNVAVNDVRFQLDGVEPGCGPDGVALHHSVGHHNGYQRHPHPDCNSQGHVRKLRHIVGDHRDGQQHRDWSAHARADRILEFRRGEPGLSRTTRRAAATTQR